MKTSHRLSKTKQFIETWVVLWEYIELLLNSNPRMKSNRSMIGGRDWPYRCNMVVDQPKLKTPNVWKSRQWSATADQKMVTFAEVERLYPSKFVCVSVETRGWFVAQSHQKRKEKLILSWWAQIGSVSR